MARMSPCATRLSVYHATPCVTALRKQHEHKTSYDGSAKTLAERQAAISKPLGDITEALFSQMDLNGASSVIHVGAEEEG